VKILSNTFDKNPLVISDISSDVDVGASSPDAISRRRYWISKIMVVRPSIDDHYALKANDGHLIFEYESLASKSEQFDFTPPLWTSGIKAAAAENTLASPSRTKLLVYRA
jgi:hypothetical protein